MRILRRFVAVGALATAVDFGGFLVLHLAVGWSPLVADVVAIAAATVTSFVLHRWVTFAADPSRRWYRNHGAYLAASGLALCADAVIVTFTIGQASQWWWVALVKAVALTVAFGVRLSVYRLSMFEAVRADQQTPVARPPAPGELRLSLVVPAYGEEEAIGATVERIEAELGSKVRAQGGFELIVVDDGSPDDTAGAATRAGADSVIRLQPNRGKGAAVRAGVMAARGRTVAFTDADLSYAPAQILTLMTQVEAGWDVVVGSRRHTETRTLVAARRLREIGGRVINLFTSVVLLGQYRDTQCGLKAFRSDVARAIFGLSRIDGFAFDVEVFHLVERHRFTLVEVPVEVENSPRSTVRVARDATRLVRDLFRVRDMGRRGLYELDPDALPARV